MINNVHIAQAMVDSLLAITGLSAHFALYADGSKASNTVEVEELLSDNNEIIIHLSDTSPYYQISTSAEETHKVPFDSPNSASHYIQQLIDNSAKAK